MRSVHRSDGSLWVECRADQFGLALKQASNHEKTVLPDGRPAVRKTTEVGIMYLTIHPHAWDIIKRRPRGPQSVPSRVRLCEWCRSIMKVAREFEGCWTFVCPKCKSTEIHDKRFVGGSIGAGQKEKK